MLKLGLILLHNRDIAAAEFILVLILPGSLIITFFIQKYKQFYYSQSKEASWKSSIICILLVSDYAKHITDLLFDG